MDQMKTMIRRILFALGKSKDFGKYLAQKEKIGEKYIRFSQDVFELDVAKKKTWNTVEPGLTDMVMCRLLNVFHKKLSVVVFFCVHN